MNRIFEFSEFVLESKKIIVNKVSIFSFLLGSDLGLTMPIELVKDILKWSIIYKSPYSVSFYNKEKDWNSTFDKTLRVSDHWNFTSKKHPGNIHCKTDVPIENNKYWTIAEYDLEKECYTIIKNYPKEIGEKNKPKLRALKNELGSEHREKRKEENIELQNKINNGKIEITVYDGYIINSEKIVIGQVEEPITGVLNRIAKGCIYLTDYDSGEKMMVKGLSKYTLAKYELKEI